MWPSLSSRDKKRRIIGLLAVAVGVGLVAIGVVLRQYPRQILLSDVQQSRRIIVSWHIFDKVGTRTDRAFELDESPREEFIHSLSEYLGLDYFRQQATAAPTISIYLLNAENKVQACYAIRRGRGSGLCPSMDLLRNVASKGRPLVTKELKEISDGNVRAKWPHILPWPACRYDYILPSGG
jgi:hypothetical protein